MNKITPQILTEVNEILKHSSRNVQKKIPYKFRKYLVKNLDKNYKPNIDMSKPLNEQNVKPETKHILALIYREYLTEKKQNIVQEELQQKQENFQKYNTDELFKKEKDTIPNETSKYLAIIKKENKVVKILKQVKNKLLKVFIKRNERSKC